MDIYMEVFWMDNFREQQIEAMAIAGEYCNKLINGINNIVSELRGSRLPDTDEYLNDIIKGLNWVLEVTNSTMDLVNENEVVIDKEVTNNAVLTLSNALKLKDDNMIADCLDGNIKTFLETYRDSCNVHMRSDVN